MKKKISCLVCLSLCLCMVLGAFTPAQAGAPTVYGTFVGESGVAKAPLYASPNENGKVVGTLYQGMPMLKIFTPNEGFYFVYDGESNMSGYVRKSYVANEQSTPFFWYGATVNNPTNWLNLRELPDMSARSLGMFENGKAVKVLDMGTDWCYVEADGGVGYMMTQFLKIDQSIFDTQGASAGFPQPTRWPVPQPTWKPVPMPQPTAQPYYPIDPSKSIAYVNNPVATDRLNLREAPSASSRSLGKFYNRTEVHVLERTNDASWCRVSVEGITGYMMTRYLSWSINDVNDAQTSTNAVVNNPIPSQRLNLREGPSATSWSLGKYYNGTYVKVLEYRSDWCRVEVMGKQGYMMTRYLAFDGGSNADGGGFTPARTWQAVITNPIATQRANLRGMPTTMANSLGLFNTGTPVTVLGVGSEWCRVRIDGIEGYIMFRYLANFSAGASPYTTVSHPNYSYVNLREGAGTSYGVIQRVDHGASVTVLTPYPEWSEVVVKTGAGYSQGYMLNAFLKCYQ